MFLKIRLPDSCPTVYLSDRKYKDRFYSNILSEWSFYFGTFRFFGATAYGKSVYVRRSSSEKPPYRYARLGVLVFGFVVFIYCFGRCGVRGLSMGSLLNPPLCLNRRQAVWGRRVFGV